VGERLAKAWTAKAFSKKSRWFGNFPKSLNSLQKTSPDWAERRLSRRRGFTQEGAFLTGLSGWTEGNNDANLFL
jgi:hypothetical protein